MKNIFNTQSVLKALFVILLLMVYTTLIQIHDSITATYYYSLITILLFVTYFFQKIKHRNLIIIISFILFAAGGGIFIAEIEEIEEIYLIIPLLYLYILPGTLWPILFSIILLTAYIPSLPTTEIGDFIEDSLELLVITSFATIMTFFQQKYLEQMRLFKKESNTDYLTRLRNRKKFALDMKALETKCLNSQDQLEAFTLIVVDLDGFKKINDQLGHHAGDSVLCMVAKRLKEIREKNSSPYRLGGDEFAFIVNSGKKSDIVKRHVAKLLKLSSTPYTIDMHNYYVSSSIGISTYPTDTDNIKTLYTNADLAMYKSKNSGKNSASFYDNSIMSHTVRKYDIENALKDAVNNGEMFILYQPKISLHKGKCHSAEALIRWIHPTLGFVSPAEFIPIAEECGIIVPIGKWVLEKVCEQIVMWKESINLKNIAVNVSSVQLNEPDFVNTVEKILEETGCRGEWLELEQTETWVMDNPDINILVLNKLKKLNISLSLDDFGTAYSSLSQIRRLPLDILKIDKSFIDNCVNNKQDHMLVRTIIQLAHNLDMAVIAEGVEYEEQRQLLTDEGCDYFQGYLFSKPISADEIEVIFKKDSH